MIEPRDPVSACLLECFARKKSASRGISIRTLARLLRCSPSFVHHILKGSRRASLETYARLFDILEVDPERRGLLFAQILREKSVFQSACHLSTVVLGVREGDVPAVEARLRVLLDELASEFAADRVDAVYQVAVRAVPTKK